MVQGNLHMFGPVFGDGISCMPICIMNMKIFCDTKHTVVDGLISIIYVLCVHRYTSIVHIYYVCIYLYV